jgi:hypothetical protein
MNVSVRIAAVAFAAAVSVVPHALSAQGSRQGAPPSGRGSVGIHLQGSEPRGDFGKNTDSGFGIGGYLLTSVDKSHIFNVRADLSFLTYANSTRRIPLSNTGGLIQLDMKTSSNIASFVVGPQLLGPTGVFTPYATLLGGFSVFWTQSSVEGSSNTNQPFASTTNSSDAVWAYGGAAGAYIRVYNGRNPVRIDAGARFLRHDDVRYLTDERVREAFQNNTTPVPVRGRADFVSYYLGANIIVF